MRSFGLNVEYNGDHYVALCGERAKQYAIGEMACELMRLRPADIKDILVEADHFDDPLDKDQINALLFWFRDKLLSKYPLVVGEMISIDFMNKTIEYFTTDKEKQRDWINSCLPENKEDSVSKYILEGTHYTDYGDTTNGQFLLTLCYNVSFEYCLFKGAFLSFAKSDESPEDLKQAERLLEMYGAQDNVQDIEFRIMGYDGRFNSVYTIKSFFSLLLFEMAHIIDEGVNIVKCRNCGQYFVPLKRSDTRYCNYPSPENPEKTCKEIGAQKAWANKEKTDDVTREYRKVYMRYKMTVKRHPDNKEAQQKLDRLTDGIKEWRQKLDAGEVSTADFMRWLEEF